MNSKLLSSLSCALCAVLRIIVRKSPLYVIRHFLYGTKHSNDIPDISNLFGFVN